MRANPLGFFLLLGGVIMVAALTIRLVARLFRNAIDSSVKRQLSRKP